MHTPSRILVLAVVSALAACGTNPDLRLDESLTSGDRALALRMSELTRERCVRQQYDSAVMGTTGSRTQFGALPVVRRLYRSDQEWVKAEITAEGAWDNVYWSEQRGVVICGEPNWQKLADASAVRFRDVRVQGTASSTPASPAPLRDGEQRAIAIQWEGERLVAGVVTIAQRGMSGKIAAKLPTGDGECTGMYEGNASGTGQWALSCTNGITVVGTFRALGAGKGSVGTGVDSKGRRVEFTVGGSP